MCYNIHMKPSDVIFNMELQIPAFDQEAWDALPIDKMAFADKLRDELSKSADGQKDASAVRISLRSFISEYIVKTTPDREGRLRDLLAQDWLDLVIDTNVGLARGCLQYREGLTPGAFAAFPAQELMCVRHRDEPHEDWSSRWKAAGGRFFGNGRMIALKTDRVWTALSAFGLPYPPFDWREGMGVFDVGRREAVRLGVVTDSAVKAIVENLRKAGH